MCVFLRFTSRQGPGQASQRVSRDTLREVGEKKDIHLRLSPELGHKEARCLLTAGGCLSRHQLCHLAWLLQAQTHLVTPSITGRGEGVCRGSQPLPRSLSVPPALGHADSDGQSGWDLQ